MDSIFNIVYDAVVKPLKEEVTYLFSYKSHVQDLNGKINGLFDERAWVENWVKDEERKGKEIVDRVKNWLLHVNKIIENFEKNKAGQMNTSCYNGLFPNPWSRYTLGKKAFKMAKEVDEVLQEKPNMAIASRQEPISTEVALSTIDSESFDSRKETIDKLKEKLKDSSVGKIGVYGPSGVGKTTLVKNVAREFHDKFKVVVFASVTRNPDLKKIQGAIADFLDLRLGEESEIGRAERIRERLNKEKENTLIILDDLWVELDLNRLGIPIASRDFKSKTSMKVEGIPNLDYSTNTENEKSPAEQRMFQILLTSRSKEVLSKMGVDENSMFSIGLLNEEEAKILLKKMAEVTDESPDIEPLVAKIAKKCQGLPIAITTIGKTLRGKPPNAWDSASEQLERIGFTRMSGDHELSTRVSFDFLESEELKSAFLLCAQMGSDSLNADFMKYCYGLSVLQGVHTIQEAQDRTNTLIERLKDLSLLTDSTSIDHFSMHDMVRDAALSISAQDRHVFTMRDEKLDEWPDKDELERFSSISLCNCHISDDLPKNITFPLLKFFHINGGHPFIKIPDSFKGVTKLKVLILTDIPLPHLPFSNDSNANSLRMLCLERCLLSDTDNLSVIGELKKLRVLSFSGSLIEKLPSELGKLINLQWFDISNCSQLRVIPPNVLSRLGSLEVLYMRDSPIQWGSEGQPNCKIQNATLAELSHLHQLTNLDVCIPDATVFPRNLFLDVLLYYKIVIGDSKLLSKGDFIMPKKYEAARALVLQLNEGMDIHNHMGMKTLLRKAEKLLLGELHGVKNVFYELNLEGFKSLQHFSIQNNGDIECIIDLKMSHPVDAFPNLESLCLYNLENLTAICHTNLTDSSFGKLKSIKIEGCAQLKSIFPVSMVRLLKKLERFEVSNCHSLKEIVEDENTSNTGEVVSKIEFLELRSLTLQSLPTFTSFHAGGASISPSMIFSKQVEFPQLETLKLSSINNQIQMLWSDQTPPISCLRNLVKLNVDGCNGLTYLFSFSEAKNLENLKAIYVSKCDKMEKIFKQEEISSIEEKVCIFPNLEEINLTNMRSLSAIWHPPEVSVDPYPTLSTVFIEKCEALVTIFPHHMVGLYPCLENLKISDCSSVKEIFDLKDAPHDNEAENETNLRFVVIKELPNLKYVWNQDPKGILSFKNMQEIEVGSCKNLENLFPHSFAKSLENLDSVYIHACPELREISWNEGPETSNISFEFPRLTAVIFGFLPKLKSFYQGSHSLEWPSLETLAVYFCEELEVFPIPIETKNQDNRPIFLPEKVISNLKDMTLSHKEAEWLHHYVESHLMYRLEVLCLLKLQSIAILFKILHRIPNLGSLYLWGGPVTELLPSGSPVAHENIGTVIQIKDLTLDYMHHLENIGFENDPILQGVERLFLLNCSNLINLAPSTVSFTHLKSLEVSRCNKLLNLMGSSTAKSLVKLTTMKVTECEAIEGIVAKENNEEERVDEHEIVFRKLITLELVSLKRLVSFSNCKNYNINFPALEYLIVRDCQKMKIFSESRATAPILRQVSLAYAEEDKENWFFEFDLNSILRKNSTEKVFLKYTESLELSQYPELERVWHGQDSLGDNHFRNLKNLEVTNCDFLSSVIPIHLLAYLRNLEDLRVSNCNLVEVIFDMNDTKTTFRLKTLSLKDLPNLKHVWNKDPQGLISFRSLQEVSVDGCKRLETLFSKSVAKNLLKLEELDIKNCRALEEIVGKEDAAADGGTDEMFEFPRLAKLRLSELRELKCFYWGRFNVKCPVLEDLYVNQCGKLEIFKSESQSYEKAASEDQIIPIEAQSLLSVQEDPEPERVWHGQFSLLDDCFCNLKSLAVTDCDFLSSVILFHLLAYLSNLENLRLSNCNLVEVIFDMNDTKMTKAGEEAFHLKTLSLKDLPKLKHVWSKDSQGFISFHSLQDVSVDGCKRLKTLFPKSVAKNLSKLEELDIKNCRALEEIVGKEDAAADGAIDEMFEFPRLAKLRLSELPELKCFYCGRFNLKCPVLKDLDVNHCGKLEIFKSESESYEKAALEDEIIPTEAQSLFSVQEDPELVRVWHQVFLPNDCFCNLKTLKVTNCDVLSSVIPFHLFAYLSNLEELRLSNCNLVEVIFDMNDTKMTKTGEEAFRLKTLSLDGLPNLKHVWSKDPKGLISFGSLQDVSVDNCKRLRTLFPKSVAKNLLKLKKLSITVCRALEEIVGKEDAAADGAIDEMFEFLSLAVLLLIELPELKCFYWGRFNLKCPLLEVLFVIHCGKLEIFKSESQSSEKAASEDQIIRIEAQSLFSVQEVISTLGVVALNERDIKMLWRGGFQESLHNLKSLLLQGFHNVNETDPLPFEILQKVPNLETLLLDCCDFKEISFSGIFEDYHVTMPAPFKRLELCRLPRLNSIGSKHSSIDSVLENLEFLRVRVCPCLTKLIQSSVPFSSLKELHIDQCDGLVHLFTSSTVKSLVRLEEIHVKRCESIAGIVAEDRDDSDSANEILFEQLKVLDLNSLPSLGSFYSGRSTLKFPYLKDFKIIKCPRMNTFSNGITEVPILGRIQVSEKNSLEVHDLKSTVDKLFNEKISFAYMGVLKLSNYPELEPLWLGKVPLQENCLSNMKTLMVENCEFLSNVIPSNLLPYLKSLEELRVRNCTSVEVIFDINEIKTSETEQKGFLLKKLTLDQLPNLKLVWNKNPQRIMSFEKLQKVKVSNCKSLQYLFPAASMAKHLLKLKVQNCEALEEILGKEEVSETFEFHYLTTVILNHLPELNCFYPARLNLKCPKLKVLNVYHCGKLEMFTSETRSSPAIPEDQVGVSVNAAPIFTVEEVTSKLEEVSFSEKETITLWHEEYQANFGHNIKCLQLYCFHSVTDKEDTLPYRFLQKTLNLEILAVACSDFEMIFPSGGLEDEYIGVLSKLKGLRLEALPKLNSIGLEHSWLVTLSGNLKTLEIRICPSLTNIVQSAVSFSNLRELTVIECHGLVHLFTSSTAKSLGQLRNMSIGKCKSMREIVAKEEKESSEDEIVFGELTKLSLNNLPNLGSFYAGDSTLRFPYLQKVIITQCSRMKVFSEGFISAPQLPSIIVSLEKWDECWEGDLNSTVKKLCKGKELIVNS